MKTSDDLTRYIAAFVDELVRVDVKDVVISPGSRSTPIAILMAEHPDLNVHINIDERSAGFFALGMAKAKRSPVALLCTSGTAAANYYPAVIEAYESRIPLIVLTADRPHELRDVGAPQAINQINLYGSYAKWFVEMALPENKPGMLRYARTVAARAAATALTSPSGPVHLNFPLREPLLPDLSAEQLWERNDVLELAISAGSPSLKNEEYQRIAAILEGTGEGLIVCGAHDVPGFSDAVVTLGEATGFPILADPLSQLRGGKHTKDAVIDSYDAFLRDEAATAQLVPKVVIRFGAMPVSKALTLYLQKHPETRQIVVDGDGGWREPTLRASEMIYCDEALFCEKVTALLKGPKESPWLKKWKALNASAKEIIKNHLQSNDILEGKVFSELQEILPEQSAMFVGNSMPIRDLDSFFLNDGKNIRLLANRGANGIDGLVSTAMGASKVLSPFILVLGDLSFYHDLNGLLAAKLHQLDITVIVINNNGGGIFSFLPQAGEKKHFEALFGTPVDLDFKHAVTMYGGTFSRIQSWEEFRQKVDESFSKGGLNVIEVVTDRQENVTWHRNVWKSVSQEINSYGEDK